MQLTDIAQVEKRPQPFGMVIFILQVPPARVALADAPMLHPAVQLTDQEVGVVPAGQAGKVHAAKFCGVVQVKGPHGGWQV